MKLHQEFRFRMQPTASERQLLLRMAGARRFVWNWALAERQQHYRQTGKTLPLAELSRRLTRLKQQPQTAWLKEVDSQALQQVLSDLQRAYSNFFAQWAGLPRFKSRKRDQARFRIPPRVVVSEGHGLGPQGGTGPHP